MTRTGGSTSGGIRRRAAIGPRPPTETMMVGDDVSDVLAAQRAGITGVLMRTGKFQAKSLRAADGSPGHVIDSFADLPALLRGSAQQ